MAAGRRRPVTGAAGPGDLGPATLPLRAGARARIRQPGIPNWPVPTSRLAFDEFQRGARESDGSAIEHAFEVSEWIAVNHDDAVRVVAIDGEVVEIELLAIPHVGRHAWVLRHQLTPAD